MKLTFEVAVAGAVFLVNPCTGSIGVQSFALYNIADTQIQRCHDADVEHVAPVCEHELTAAPDNHDVPSVGRCSDDIMYDVLVGSFVHRGGRSNGEWCADRKWCSCSSRAECRRPNIAYAIQNTRESAFDILVVMSGYIR